MIRIDDFIKDFFITFKSPVNTQPWHITTHLKEILETLIPELGEDYILKGKVAIHKTALIEHGAVIKEPAIIGEHCFVGANAYFREGVYLDKSVKIGPGCEIKSSIICSDTSIAHFNYIGNSIIGRHVNFEAGSIAANHYNERVLKQISVLHNNAIIETGTEKFGSLVGDDSKIGANAVLSPGTILNKDTVVKRLQLIEQIPAA